MEPWRTAIATSDATNIWIHGYDISSLMERKTFADTVFLLHQGRLPGKNERRLLDAILIAVADHGVGIPAGDVGRIFERFYKVDKARVRGKGGTGLGLAIVRHIAESHGGRVWVESVEGKGTTFSVALPAGDAT